MHPLKLNTLKLNSIENEIEDWMQESKIPDGHLYAFLIASMGLDKDKLKQMLDNNNADIFFTINDG